MKTPETLKGHENDKNNIIESSRSDLENLRLKVAFKLLDKAKKGKGREELTFDEYKKISRFLVELTKKTELNDEECKFISEFSRYIDKGGEVIKLNVKKLTDVQIGELSKIFALDMPYLRSITDKQAKELGKVKILAIDGLRKITDKQAESLNNVDKLYIDKNILTTKQKEILKKHVS